MKPTTISAKTKKTELLILLLCFCTSIILNVLSIIIYKTSWREIFTQLHIVLILTVAFYLLLLFFRGLGWLVLRLVKK